MDKINQLYAAVHSLDKGEERSSRGQTMEIASNTLDVLAVINRENPMLIQNWLGGRDINRTRRRLAEIAAAKSEDG